MNSDELAEKGVFHIFQARSVVDIIDDYGVTIYKNSVIVDVPEFSLEIGRTDIRITQGRFTQLASYKLGTKTQRLMLAPPSSIGEFYDDQEEAAEWTAQGSRLDWILFRPNQITLVVGQTTHHYATMPSEMWLLYAWFCFQVPLTAMAGVDDHKQAWRILPRATMVDQTLVVQVHGQRWVFDCEGTHCLDPLEYWQNLVLEREFVGLDRLHSMRSRVCSVHIERDNLSICRDGKRTHIYHSMGWASDLDRPLWPNQE